MSCENLFLKQLRQRGFRLTPQRQVILMVLHQIGHPATADEIFAQAAEKNPRVEITTVYRTLDLLHSMNMVSMIDSGDKQRLYVLAVESTPHFHLVCRECGQVIGVELELFQPLIDALKANQHFNIDTSDITIPGICEGCQGEAQKNETGPGC